METITCDSCNQPMILDNNFGAKPRGKKQSSYRIRRFKCEFCDITKTVFATGNYDEKVEPSKAISHSKAISYEEQRNRKTRKGNNNYKYL